MHHPSLTRLAASIAGGFTALALSAAVASAQAASTSAKPVQPEKSAAGTVAPAACTVKFAVDSIPSSASPLVVNAALSSAIGDSASAAFPGPSGISVVAVGPAAVGGANALQLTLNTSAAKAGEWTVSFKGKTGECTGKLKVVAGSQ